jgi:hypothetical protein
VRDRRQASHSTSASATVSVSTSGSGSAGALCRWLGGLVAAIEHVPVCVPSGEGEDCGRGACAGTGTGTGSGSGSGSGGGSGGGGGGSEHEAVVEEAPTFADGPHAGVVGGAGTGVVLWVGG